MNRSILQNKNIQAFLKVIRFSEGTDGPDGYRTMFGGTRKKHRLFDNDFKDHPRIPQRAAGLTSTAAGAYQFLSTTWDELAHKLDLKDFSPDNQDYACCQLISDNNALNDVWNGKFDVAIQKLNKVWASFPGSPYGQPTHTLTELSIEYIKQGGIANQA